MDYICMKRNGRSGYTIADIFNALKKNSSVEFGYNRNLTYNIHLDEEGNILCGMHDDSEDFVHELNYTDYGLTEEEWDIMDENYIYDHETWDCEAFVEAIDDLTEQVNRYLKKIDNEC